jgi:mycofactocin precursor
VAVRTARNGRVLHQSDAVYHRSRTARPTNGDIIVDAVTIDTDGRDTAADTADPAADPAGDTAALLDEELLVEEVSIDGMCGVY